MTRVDFYVLNGTPPAGRERFACQLVEKAWHMGHRVYLHAADADQAQRLDDLLWTFRQGSFIPHARTDAGSADPDLRVYLGHADDPPEGCDVLVNLGDGVPRFFSRFERLAEIVADDESSRAAGRERWRHYRERGFEPATHEIQAGAK